MNLDDAVERMVETGGTVIVDGISYISSEVLYDLIEGFREGALGSITVPDEVVSGALETVSVLSQFLDSVNEYNATPVDVLRNVVV